tara:strand:+ start:346 stop:876 length:531 start_codon:yes stop_codon:yes gene_type:complete
LTLYVNADLKEFHVSLNIRQATPLDIGACFHIESNAYAGDEAASREKIATRINTYPEGFLIAEQQEQVVGIINAGAAFNVELSDEDFKSLIGHDPAGPNMVVMSVAVLPEFQHQGIGVALVKAFIAHVTAMHKKAIYLICQEALIGWYQQFGFEDLGPSDSTHGGLAWHEMVLKLD